MSYLGGCQCGAVRYEIASETLSSYVCHCRECQKQSASGFGISVPVLEAAFSLKGELGKYSRKTDSASHTDCYFCPRCGTRLYHDGTNRPGLITVKGGSLDEAGTLEPLAHIWTRSKQEWIVLPGDAVQFETQPNDTQEWMQLLGWAN